LNQQNVVPIQMALLAAEVGKQLIVSTTASYLQAPRPISITTHAAPAEQHEIDDDELIVIDEYTSEVISERPSIQHLCQRIRDMITAVKNKISEYQASEKSYSLQWTWLGKPDFQSNKKQICDAKRKIKQDFCLLLKLTRG
jgi:hypothetical protein